jgi:DNA-binding transcriptional MerR regulator
MVTPPWADPGRGLFSISVAAELTGLHPHKLRLYDQEGLLSPARSPGGARRYSTDDIDRLQQIMTLTSDGVNLAGVRRILQLQEQARQLHAELEQLKTAARGTPSGIPAGNSQPGPADPPAGAHRKQSSRDAGRGPQTGPGALGANATRPGRTTRQ